MNNYFIWFKINNDLDNSEKSKYSRNIHNFLFKNDNGMKLKDKSNAFFYKSNNSNEQITNKIVQLSTKKIKLMVIKLDNYQGWLEKEQWEFLGY